MTLFELCDALKNFNLEIDEETGEILNAAELDALELERDTKIENIALWIKNLKAEAEAVKKQKEVFYQREKALTNKADRLKEWLAQTLDGEKWKSDKVVLSWRRSEAVSVDEGFSDERFITYEPKVSKTAIKEALKNGEIISGARLVENNSLQIR